MPTAKPRITITLSEHQHAVLSSLAELQKVSMSSIVVDLLDTTLPVLERLGHVLHNAANAPQSVLDELRRSAQQAETDTFAASTSVMEQLDFLVAASSGEAGAAAPAMPEKRDSSERPPTSNRGVRIRSPRAKIEQISPSKSRSYSDSNGRAKK